MAATAPAIGKSRTTTWYKQRAPGGDGPAPLPALLAALAQALLNTFDSTLHMSWRLFIERLSLMLEARLATAAESVFRPVILGVARALRAPAAPWWAVLVVAGLLLRARRLPPQRSHALTPSPHHAPQPPMQFAATVPGDGGTWQWQLVPAPDDDSYDGRRGTVEPPFPNYARPPAAPLLLGLSPDGATYGRARL